MRKTFTLLFATLIISFYAEAQQVLFYSFENTLQEVSGYGPELTVLGNEGIYEVVTLDEIAQKTKTVYRFEKNSGLQFNNESAGAFIGESYTIEIYFEFDELSSWKRVVDWKNRKTDWGAYVYNGELNFYNILYSEEAPVVAGEFTYYVITRDAVTKKVLIYTDAEVKIDFIDDNGHALIDQDGMLNFFHDDLIVQNEASAGSVGMLKLYNYTLDSTIIQDNWIGLGSQVFGINRIKEKIPVLIYPNPVSASAYADLSAFDEGKQIEIDIYNADGRMVYQTIVKNNSDRFEIGTSMLPSGLYLLRAVQANKIANSQILVR